MKNIIQYFLFASSLFFLFSSCSKPKTEKEQYEDMTSSLKYKSYKATSETTLPPSVKIYKANAKNQYQAPDENFLRLLLGYNWAVTGQSEFAFAESDIVTETAKNPEEKFLAGSLRAIVMYENGWDTLAKEESDMSVKNVSAQSASQIKTQIIVFHLILGTAYIKRKDYEHARFHFAGFGKETGINWPYQICDAANDIDKGNVQQGLIKIKKMSEDPAVPVEIREILKNGIAEIEKQHGDVNSSLFWPKAISSIIFKQLNEGTNKEIQDMMKFADELAKTGI